MFTINISEEYIPEPVPEPEPTQETDPEPTQETDTEPTPQTDPEPTQEPIKSDNNTNPEIPKNTGLSSKNIGLIVGLVVPGVLIIAFLIFFFVRRYKLRKKNDLEKNFKIEYVD